jgi:hypothetical protein
MITVTVGEQKPQEKPFPKLMISSDFKEIVFFIESEYGVMITYSGDGPDRRKQCHAGYNMEFFTDYNEPITLQNA